MVLDNIFFVAAFSILNVFLINLLNKNSYHILQLQSYRTKRYLKNIFKFNLKKIICLNILLSLYIALTLVLYFVVEIWLIYIVFALFYSITIIILIQNNFKTNYKIKIKFQLTKRALRVVVLVSLIQFCLVFVALYCINQIEFILLFVLSLLIFSNVIVGVGNAILIPFEKCVQLRFKLRAKKKLLQNKNLIKIGITGSYGKTSTKNFLKVILEEKFSVCATPSSYNTPMGITKSVLEYLNFTHEIFIAEMGAKQVGDIQELCNIVEPSIGIVTAVGQQHLETFKNIEKVKQAKFELVKNIEDKGFLVLNGENEICCEFSEKTNCKKSIVGLNSNLDVYAKNIKMDLNGMHFDLFLKKQYINCKTEVLGIKNLQNILCCVAVANYLGLTLEEIKSGIEKLKPIEHRLQILKVDENLTIIDDSFSGNIEGARQALEILTKFKCFKIVITPGIVELGEKQVYFNEEFGAQLAKCADIIVLVNQTNRNSILRGISKTDFNLKNILTIDSISQLTQILIKFANKKRVILFYNDLPDNFK